MIGPAPIAVACPKCGARAGKPCRESSGAKAKKDHAARVALVTPQCPPP